jgi:hypothetical protein
LLVQHCRHHHVQGPHHKHNPAASGRTQHWTPATAAVPEAAAAAVVLLHFSESTAESEVWCLRPWRLLLLLQHQLLLLSTHALVPVGVPYRRAHAALAACVGGVLAHQCLLLDRAQLREGRIRPGTSNSSSSSSSSSGTHCWPHGMQGAQLCCTSCLLRPAAAATGTGVAVWCWPAAAAVAVHTELTGRRFQPAATAAATAAAVN